MIKNITICDTTLRDGEQMPGIYFKPEEKIKLAMEIDEFGVDIIELMPAISKTERLVAKALANAGLNAEIRAACSLSKKTIEEAAELELNKVVLFTPISELHINKKLGISKDENLERALEMIDLSRELGMKVDFACEDASRAPTSDIKSFANAIKKKIDFFVFTDTVGILTPEKTTKFIKELKSTKAKIEFHGHNDMGMATANTLAAIKAGADSFSGTFCGIGERAGNAAIEEVVVALHFLEGKKLGVKYSMIKEICDMVGSFSNARIQPHKPIVGENFFTHESGIHADAVIKEPSTYAAFDPSFVGHKRKLVFGKHSGKNMIKFAISKHHHGINDEEARTVLNIVKIYSENTKRTMNIDEVRWVYEQLFDKRFS